MQKQLRESDLIARWGGEEFIVMIDNVDKRTAQKVAEKVRKAVEEFSDENLPHFTISIGIAIGDKNTSLETLIKKADTALYKAKETGRNKVVVSEE